MVIPDPSRIRHQSETEPFATLARQRQIRWSDGARSTRSLRPYTAPGLVSAGFDAQGRRGLRVDDLDCVSADRGAGPRGWRAVDRAGGPAGTPHAGRA